MKGIDFKGFFGHVWTGIRKKSPQILTAVGISGMFATTVLAVRATPEAMRRIEEKKKEDNVKRLPPLEVIRTTWKCYIPAGVTGAVSTACLLGANRLHTRRNAALAAAASIAETGLREYRSKVLETLGEKKEQVIREAVDKERIEKDPPPPEYTNEAIFAEGPRCGTLCYDKLFGRYFYSDVETLRRAENKLNRQMSMMCEPYISLNEFYGEIGLPYVDVGDDLGWNVSRGMIDLAFSSQLANGRIPCIVMEHLIPPMYGYNF